MDVRENLLILHEHVSSGESAWADVTQVELSITGMGQGPRRVQASRGRSAQASVTRSRLPARWCRALLLKWRHVLRTSSNDSCEGGQIPEAGVSMLLVLQRIRPWYQRSN